MPKPKTVTGRKRKLPNKVTYVTVYLRVCKEHVTNIFMDDKFTYVKYGDCCHIIPYKLKLPKQRLQGLRTPYKLKVPKK